LTANVSAELCVNGLKKSGPQKARFYEGSNFGAYLQGSANLGKLAISNGMEGDPFRSDFLHGDQFPVVRVTQNFLHEKPVDSVTGLVAGVGPQDGNPK